MVVRSRLLVVVVAVTSAVAACGSNHADRLGAPASTPPASTQGTSSGTVTSDSRDELPPPTTGNFVPDPSSTVTTPVERPECEAPIEPGEWHRYCIAGDPDTHVSMDGLDLSFRFVGGAEYVADDPCTQDYRVDLHETPTEVRAEIWTRTGMTTAQDYACLGIGYLRTATARLAQPLGARKVILDHDGGELDVSDTARIATAHWLPDGRHASPPAPFRDGGWEHVFEGRNTPGDCGEDDALLVLYQGPPPLLDTLRAPGKAPVSTHTVHGVQAEYWLGGGFPTAQLRWSENGQDLMLTSDAPCDDTEPVPLTTMLRIARHLSVPPS